MSSKVFILHIIKISLEKNAKEGEKEDLSEETLDFTKLKIFDSSQ